MSDSSLPLPFDSLISHFDTIEATKEYKNSIAIRMQQELKLSRAKEVDKAIQKGEALPESSIELPPIEDENLPLNFKLLDENEAITQAVRQKDEIVISHLFKTREVDELLIISLDEFDTLFRLTFDLYRAHTKSRERVVDLLLPELTTFTYEKALLRSFMDIYGKNTYSLLSISSTIPSLEVSVNGNRYEKVDYIFTDDEIITLTYKAPNYISRTDTIEVTQKSIELIVNLEPTKPKPLLIRSFDTLDVTISKESPISLPIIYTPPTFPFTISASKMGFLDKSIIVTSLPESIDIELQEKHISPSLIIIEAQDSFYASLWRTALIASSSILISSLFPANSIDGIPPIHSLSYGFTIVSGIETIFRLFDYYEKTKYSIKN